MGDTLLSLLLNPHVPLPVVCGYRLLLSSGTRGTPCARMYWPLGSGSHWPPSYLSIPQASGILPLPGRSVLGLGARLSGTVPTTEGLGRAKPHSSAMASLRMAGLQQFWLKKRWKINESGRG